MDAWDVYWVMQADSIRSFLGAACVPLSVIVALLGTFRIIMSDFTHPPEEIAAARPAVTRIIVASGIALFFLSAGYAFAPTTKTLCACIAVPAIANNEQLQADATDIYKLGMERLKEELAPAKE
jgi:hypothetical protein